MLFLPFESITIIAFIHLNINYKNARRIQLDSTIGNKTTHLKISGKILPFSNADSLKYTIFFAIITNKSR